MSQSFILMLHDIQSMTPNLTQNVPMNVNENITGIHDNIRWFDQFIHKTLTCCIFEIMCGRTYIQR